MDFLSLLDGEGAPRLRSPPFQLRVRNRPRLRSWLFAARFMMTIALSQSQVPLVTVLGLGVGAMAPKWSVALTP